MKTRSYQHSQNGFSLIELLISIALFSVVITMAVGTMIVLLDANAKAQNMNVLMTNLSFSLNSISREIRTGFSYYCDNYVVPGNNQPSDTIPQPESVRDCTNGTRFSVVETDNSLTQGARGTYNQQSRITYYFAPAYYGTDHGAILRRLGTGPALPLTSEEIDIDKFQFLAVGTVVGTDNQTPRVRIDIAGTAGDIEGIDTSFQIQTMVTQRLLDI